MELHNWNFSEKEDRVMKRLITCVFSLALVIPCGAQELQAPSECEVGELVIIEAVVPDEADVAWGIRPGTEDFRVFENGRVAVFSGRAVGEFMVIAACSIEGEAELLIHELSVVSRKPNSLEADVLKAVKAVEGYPDFESKRVALVKLEVLFRSLATEFRDENDLNATVGVAIQAVLRDEQARWEPLFDVISLRMNENFSEGNLDYGKIWTAVADALKKAQVPC
jgi:hypothetical protein